MAIKIVKVRRFDISIHSGGPISLRVIAYENQTDQDGFSISSNVPGDTHEGIILPLVTAVAESYPKSLKNVTITVNDNKEIEQFNIP